MNIMIGYDNQEPRPFHVCKKSLIETASIELNISDININHLPLYYRQKDYLSSTEFTFSRFLVPFLSAYKGWTLFCDHDFVFIEDVKNLFDLVDDRYAVMVCKHNYEPTNKTKMGNKIQTIYPRKNWSSLVLWNCSHPSNKQITPEVVNTESGSYLHRFMWLKDNEIGEIPIQWNWLVDWYKEPKDGKPKALHFTEGGPWLKEYKNCEYADEYNKYK